MIERRSGLNFRVQGRTVSGTALRYGDVADLGSFREMFVAGAFSPIGSVALNLQHDPARVLAKTGNGLVLADGPRSLEVRAELTGRAEHDLVRRGVLRGFSIEFRAKNQRYEGGTRIIETADLTGIALCDEPAYPESVAEARRARGTGKTARLKLIHPLILLSNDTKDSLEYPLLHKHLQKPLHQWTDSLIRPVGNMVIQHQPLTKQRVRTIFHRVRL